MSLPKHIGIIMDGNGRWAKKRGLQRTEGHAEGVAAFERICAHASDLGIPYLTFYAFSTENWSRPPAEVSAIFTLFQKQLEQTLRNKEENVAKGWRFRYIGALEDGGPVPASVLALLREQEVLTQEHRHLTVNIAVNYGGRQEILSAARAFLKKVQTGECRAEDLTEEVFAEGLWTADSPEPDLIIRPSGEQRLSNFLLWQAAYSEFWFSDILWPDFSSEHLDLAIEDYQKRQRRFGQISK